MPPSNDDPLIMPVERLRECVAREVMRWHWENCTGWKTEDDQFACESFWPNSNPLHTQMVKDKMQSMGWQYFVAPFPSITEPPTNSAILLAPIWRYNVGFVNWGWMEVAIEAPSIEEVGIASCRSALLAERT
jgi:hypothetical protein